MKQLPILMENNFCGKNNENFLIPHVELDDNDVYKNDGKFECDQCNVVFSKEYDFEVHVLNCKRKFKCDEYDKQFSVKWNVNLPPSSDDVKNDT